MIPLYLITGFLGSGKTTLLLALAKKAKEEGRKYLFLVNEFSGKDVDGRRLKGLGGEAVVIPGGSIFCTCLVHEFILQLSEIPLKFGENSLDGVVVEASGMANPSAVDRMLRESQLDKTFEVARIISMADPHTLGKVTATLKAAREQLSASDLILLSKVDTVDMRTLAHTQAIIRKHNTHASILECENGKVRGEVLQAIVRKKLDGELMECVDPAFVSHTMAVEPGTSVRELEDFFLEYGPFVHRAKGCVETNKGWIEFDAVGSRCDNRVGQKMNDSQLVVITSAKAPKPELWIHRFDGAHQ